MADQNEYSDNSTIEDEVVYQPKTEETRAAYKTLLSIIQQQLGDEQSSIKVTGVADEILAILKHDIVKISDKKKEIEVILNPIPNHIFDEIVSIGNLITDFDTATDCNSDTLSREFGIIGEQEDFLHDKIMLRARNLGIEAEMEKLPPIPTLPLSLLRIIGRIHKERIDIMLRNAICIARAIGMDA